MRGKTLGKKRLVGNKYRSVRAELGLARERGGGGIIVGMEGIGLIKDRTICSGTWGFTKSKAFFH